MDYPTNDNQIRCYNLIKEKLQIEETQWRLVYGGSAKNFKRNVVGLCRNGWSDSRSKIRHLRKPVQRIKDLMDAMDVSEWYVRIEHCARTVSRNENGESVPKQPRIEEGGSGRRATE